jgi:hypothetical protein
MLKSSLMVIAFFRPSENQPCDKQTLALDLGGDLGAVGFNVEEVFAIEGPLPERHHAASDLAASHSSITFSAHASLRGDKWTGGGNRPSLHILRK